MISFRTLVFASSIALAAAPALAAEKDKDMHASMPGMENMMGAHDMSATVSAIDPKTGMVDVDAGGMKLKVHFPPSSLTNVKAGDKITVHLAFRKP